MHEFVPQRTAAYISQHDLHIGEMTVRETLAFSARCQGVGTRYGKHPAPLTSVFQGSYYYALPFAKYLPTSGHLTYLRMVLRDVNGVG